MTQLLHQAGYQSSSQSQQRQKATFLVRVGARLIGGTAGAQLLHQAVYHQSSSQRQQRQKPTFLVRVGARLIDGTAGAQLLHYFFPAHLVSQLVNIFSRVTVNCFPFDVIVFAMLPAHGIWRETVSLLDAM